MHVILDNSHVTKPSLTSTLRAILAQVRGLQYINKMASSKVVQEVS